MMDIIRRTLVATFMFATFVVITYTLIVLIFGKP